jgi:hypothetical protein
LFYHSKNGVPAKDRKTCRKAERPKIAENKNGVNTLASIRLSKDNNQKDMNSSSIIDQISESLEGSIMQENPNGNLERSERLISIGTGAFIGLKGLGNIFSHPLIALTELGLGGALLYRGMTGFCHVKAAMAAQEGNPVAVKEMDRPSASEVNDRIDPEVAY